VRAFNDKHIAGVPIINTSETLHMGAWSALTAHDTHLLRKSNKISSQTQALAIDENAG
jgi:hypothetical protein